MDEKFNNPFEQSGFPNQSYLQQPYPAQQYANPQYPNLVYSGIQQYPTPPQGIIVPSAAQQVLENTQMLTPAGFRPLSHDEREEAARIAAEAGFSFEGYQVVRREFFSHKFDPTLTIKANSITFNNACISKLDEVVYIQFLINPLAEKLVIRPCNEDAKDAIRWCVVKSDKRKSREISCGMFMEKLHDMMGWEKMYRYKLQGSMIRNNGEQLFLFDLTSREVFLPQTKDTAADGTAKPRRSQAFFPADWRDSFGIPVLEHARSTDINLSEGFEQVDVKQTDQIVMDFVEEAQ